MGSGSSSRKQGNSAASDPESEKESPRGPPSKVVVAAAAATTPAAAPAAVPDRRSLLDRLNDELHRPTDGSDVTELQTAVTALGRCRRLLRELQDEAEELAEENDQLMEDLARVCCERALTPAAC